MARIPRPSRISEAAGTYKAHPSRRKQQPVPNGPLGDAPERLREEEQAIWQELAASLPANVAGDCDRTAFEILVVLVAQFRSDKARMKTTAMNVMTNLMTKFGMDPIGRLRINVVPVAEDDPLETFLEEKGRTQ